MKTLYTLFLGIWYNIMNFINICGVISNGFLIAFTSEIGREQPLYMKFAIVIAFEVSLSGSARGMCKHSDAFGQVALIRFGRHKIFFTKLTHFINFEKKFQCFFQMIIVLVLFFCLFVLLVAIF